MALPKEDILALVVASLSNLMPIAMAPEMAAIPLAAAARRPARKPAYRTRAKDIACKPVRMKGRWFSALFLAYSNFFFLKYSTIAPAAAAMTESARG